jgi:hypothetical protein
MVRVKAFSAGLLAVLLASSVRAQSITVDTLDAAQAFTPGIDVAQPLDADAWQGTNAPRALRLLGAMPLQTDHPVLRDMMRRVVLSGLVPPAGADAAYDQTRIAVAQSLASPDEYEQFAARNPAARDPRLRADAFIAAGDLMAACGISDALQQGRGETYWVRLRAACHEARGETAAADLARDLLRDRGEDTTLVVPDPPDDFWVRALALDAAGLDAFMTEMAGPPQNGPEAQPPTDLMGPPPNEVAPPDSVPFDPTAGTDTETPISLFPQAVAGPTPPPPPPFDFATERDTAGDQSTARLFILAKAGDARAVSAFVDRAVAAGLNANQVLSRIPAILDPTDMAMANLALFARYAALTRDVDLMQALFVASEDDAAKDRLALAADALGGGFYGRPLGESLETALQDEQDGAWRDVMIALGLGADLTEPVEQLLNPLRASQADLIDWVAVDHAIDRGAQAELLLRLSILMAREDMDAGEDLYRALRSLRKAGLSDTAGQLAAYSFLERL